MRQAIALMRQAGVVERTGGPFGAVEVREGVVLGAAGNSVLRDHDPTAHAEVNAIRQACRTLGGHDLTGAVLYASGECCPMGYAAACWDRIDKVFSASRWSDDADLFDDARIHADLARPNPERLLAPEPGQGKLRDAGPRPAPSQWRPCRPLSPRATWTPLPASMPASCASRSTGWCCRWAWRASSA